MVVTVTTVLSVRWSAWLVGPNDSKVRQHYSLFFTVNPEELPCAGFDLKRAVLDPPLAVQYLHTQASKAKWKFLFIGCRYPINRSMLFSRDISNTGDRRQQHPSPFYTTMQPASKPAKIRPDNEFFEPFPPYCVLLTPLLLDQGQSRVQHSQD